MSDPKQTANDSKRGGTSTDPSTNGGFSLEIDESLLAEALAAVEARERPRVATPDEMAEFAADLDISEPSGERDSASGDPDSASGDPDSASGDPDSASGDPDSANDEFAIDFDDEPDGEPLPEPESTDASASQPSLDFSTLAGEWERIEGELDLAHERIRELEDKLHVESRERRRAASSLRIWKERAEKGESRAEYAREARGTAEEQVRRLQAARSQADTDIRQMRERRQREQTEQRKHGHAPVLLEMLSVLDHLEMAQAHANADPHRVVEGVRMVVGQFHATLERLGVERVIATPGTPFQPESHEAIMEVPSEEQAPGSVVAELAPGYRLSGRLLRAARVSVAAPPPTSAPPNARAPNRVLDGWVDPEEVPHEPPHEASDGEE